MADANVQPQSRPKHPTAVIPVPAEKLGDDVKCWIGGKGVPPLFIEAKAGRFKNCADAVAWVAEHRPELDRLILEHGGIWLRGFPVKTAEDFNAVVGKFPPFEAGYVAGASPRKKITGQVLESTQLDEKYKITLHSEMSYVRRYPPRISFFCKQASPVGGETILGSMRTFMERMPKDVQQMLEKHKIRGIRNFGPAGMSKNKSVTDHSDSRGWDDAFYTDSREDVESECEKLGLETIWHEDGSLTVIGDTDPFAVHPTTGERIYRSIIHSNRKLDSPSHAKADQAVRAKQKYPSGYLLDNGEDLTLEQARAIYDTYEDVEIAWPWQEGDIMILDNLLCAHGRNPFSGPREILTALLR